MSLGLDKLTLEDRVVLAQSAGLMAIFEDPISFEIMEKAMMTTCGHSFSEETINNWILKKNQCPLCNKPLKKSDVTPNYALRNAIARFLTAQTHLQQNIQNSLGNVSVSSEWTTPASPTADDWKTEDGVPTSSDSKLLIEVISARDLKTDWFGNTDPYCVLEFQDQKRKTTTVHRNRCPAWGEVFVFNVMNMHAESNIVVSVWDKDRFLKDSFIGMVTVSMAEVITTLKMVRRFVLQKKRVNSRKKIGGDILLRLQFLDLRANYELGRSTLSLSPSSSRVSTPLPASSSPPSSPRPFHQAPPHIPIPPPLPPQNSPILPRRAHASPVQSIRGSAGQHRRVPSRIAPRNSLGLNRYGQSGSDLASGSGSGGGRGSGGPSSSARAEGASGSGGEFVGGGIGAYRLASSSSEPIFRNLENENIDSDTDSDRVAVAGGSSVGGGSVSVNASEAGSVRGIAVRNEVEQGDADDEDENENDNENENENENEDDASSANENHENNNNHENDEDDAGEGNGNNNFNNEFNNDFNNEDEPQNENGGENEDGNDYENQNANENVAENAEENAEENAGENSNINERRENSENFENFENVGLDVDIRVDDLNNQRNTSPLFSSLSSPLTSTPHTLSQPSSSAHTFSNPSSTHLYNDSYFSDDWSLPPPPLPPVEDLTTVQHVSFPTEPPASHRLRSSPAHFFPTDARYSVPLSTPSPPPPSPPLPSLPRSLANSNETPFTQFINSSPLLPSSSLFSSSPQLTSSPPPRRLDHLASIGLSPSMRKKGKKSPPPQTKSSNPDLDLSASGNGEVTKPNSELKNSSELAQQMYEELQALQFQLQLKDSSSFPNPEEVQMYQMEEEEDEPEEELTRERHRRNNKSTSKNSPSLPPPLSVPSPLSLSSPPLSHSPTIPTTSSHPHTAPVARSAKSNSPPSSLSSRPSSAHTRHNQQNNKASPIPPSSSPHPSSSSPHPSPRTSPHTSAHSSAQSTPSHSRNNSSTSASAMNASIKNNRANSQGRAHAAAVAALALDSTQDPSSDFPIQLHVARNPSVEARIAANEESIKSLMEMGFERDLAEFALKTCNNEMEPALDKLLNNTGQLQFELLRSLLFT